MDFDVALDEIDLTFRYLDVAEEFLSLLRSWHETGKNNDTWGKLRTIVTHSQELYIFIDPRGSPFNVGQSFELPEFTVLQVSDLVRQYGLPWSKNQINQLLALVGGHPLLIKIALDGIARGQWTLQTFLEIALIREGPYSDQLDHYGYLLQKKPELLATFKQVISADKPIRLSSEEAFKLREMGLIKYSGNDVVPFCELYRLYFTDIFRK